MTNAKTIKKVNPLVKMSDTNLLLAITITVFFLMYIGAVVFQGGGFTKPQMFFNLLNTNAGLIIAACGMSIVMVSGSIDISIGGVVALVSMCCAVYLDQHDGNVAGSIAIALAIVMPVHHAWSRPADETMFWMVPREKTPNNVPMMFPTPPVSIVPPMMEEAMAFISMPMAWLAAPDPTWRK